MSIIEKRYPDKINPGDTIGIAAPAGSFNKDKFVRGIASLEKIGFNVYVPDAIMLEDAWFAGDDDSRAAVIHELFQNPDVDAVLCARGGYGSMRILELIDYDVIKNNPKIFAGFSDISALLSAITRITGLITYHAPVVTSLADPDEMTLTGLSRMFIENKETALRAEGDFVVFQGKGEGEITGGNLTTLNHLLGTDFVPDFDSSVLMLEDIGESPYKIDRMLSQMKLAGLFNNICGVALGSFEDCGDYSDILKIFKDIFSDVNVPVIGGFKFGHSKINLPFPVGAKAILDTGKLTVTYKL